MKAARWTTFRQGCEDNIATYVKVEFKALTGDNFYPYINSKPLIQWKLRPETASRIPHTRLEMSSKKNPR